MRLPATLIRPSVASSLKMRESVSGLRLRREASNCLVIDSATVWTPPRSVRLLVTGAVPQKVADHSLRPGMRGDVLDVQHQVLDAGRHAVHQAAHQRVGLGLQLGQHRPVHPQQQAVGQRFGIVGIALAEQHLRFAETLLGAQRGQHLFIAAGCREGELDLAQNDDPEAIPGRCAAMEQRLAAGQAPLPDSPGKLSQVVLRQPHEQGLVHEQADDVDGWTAHIVFPAPPYSSSSSVPGFL